MIIVITILLVLSIILNVIFFIKLRNLSKENKKEIITILNNNDDSKIDMWGEFNKVKSES